MKQDTTQTAGRRGETLACAFLEQQGYRILCRNYRTRWGEVDVIAREGRTICFIEVKARANLSHGAPEEAVTQRKQRQISRVALSYLMHQAQTEQPCRFDVVSIIDPLRPTPESAGGDNPGIPPPAQIRLIKNAFPLQPPYAL